MDEELRMPEITAGCASGPPAVDLEVVCSISAIDLNPAGRPDAKCTWVRVIRFSPPVATIRCQAPCVVPWTTVSGALEASRGVNNSSLATARLWPWFARIR